MKRAKITEELAYPKVSALDRFTGGERAAASGEAAQRPASPVPAPEVPVKSAMIKLSVFLNREEDAYLEQLASTAKFSGGKKLSKTKLIEAMVKAFRETNLDVRGVNDDVELLVRVSNMMNK
jgi:hypothetical protein